MIIVTIAVAVALTLGSIVVGWGLRRRAWVPVAIAISGILAGEAAAMLWTVGRLIETQEAREAPLRARQDAHKAVKTRVRDAEASLEALTTTERLRAAQAALQAAQTAALTKSAEAGCRAGCIAQLEKTRTEAQSEVSAARSDLEANRQARQRELADARAALSDLPPGRVATATADALGISPLVHKLLMAVLGALSLNVGGAGFLAVAAHVPTRRPKPGRETARETPPATATIRTEDVLEHAARFLAAMLRHVPGHSAPIPEVHRAYLGWCSTIGTDPIPESALLPALARLMMGLGIRGVMIDGVPHARDVRILAVPALASRAA